MPEVTGFNIVAAAATAHALDVSLRTTLSRSSSGLASFEDDVGRIFSALCSHEKRLRQVTLCHNVDEEDAVRVANAVLDRLFDNAWYLNRLCECSLPFPLGVDDILCMISMAES